MLRRARWLILLAILASGGLIYSTYLAQRAWLKSDAPKPSEPLPADTSATAEQWVWSKSLGNQTQVELRARSFRQLKEPSTLLLEGLEMRLFKPGGKLFDRVRSASAVFDTAAGSLYADGEVEIEMNHAEDAPVGGRLLNIRSSGVTFDVKAARATTERQAWFSFDQGNGEAVGATYDSGTRELFLGSEVKLHFQSEGPGAVPLDMQAGQLVYKERESLVLLSPWSRLRRGGLSLDAGEAAVYLHEQVIDRVEAVRAQGTDRLPNRLLEFAAPRLVMFFTPKGEVRRLEAQEHATLIASSSGSRTTTNADRVNLEFDTSDATESRLTKVMAYGKAVIRSEPAAAPGRPAPAARVLTSETVELAMRAGGEEVEQVTTHSPGRIEFLPSPSRPTDKRRVIDAERMTVRYGKANAVESFRAVQVRTRTETPRQPKPAVAITTSQDLQAEFDPQTNQMTRVEQWNDFKYEEGPRRATAARAHLDSRTEIITLEQAARLWDDSGVTSADQIILDQSTGQTAASGNVASTRAAGEKKDAASGLITSSEPFQARAQRMLASDNNQTIRYEGNALVWQGAARLNADTITIDRAAGRLTAEGKVNSLLPGSARRPELTTVKAARLVYSEKDLRAVYSGGATLERTALQVKANELHAFFREERAGTSKETKLDHVFAEGAVEVAESSLGRSRRGSSAHGEYYLDEEKLVLSGGNPLLVDAARGASRGAVITWFARQDRLIVDNTGSGPSVSRIHKK
jgi:lipopolysaccharide export system protein LptA